MERLGSREAIFRAKMEITETLDDTNTLIIAKDDMFLNKEKHKGKNWRKISISSLSAKIKIAIL